MISQELKDLIKKTGGKYIVVENGKPQYVLMSWKEYKEATDRNLSIKSLTEEELVDKINDDIALWRENQDEKEKAEKEMFIGDVEKLEDIEYVRDLPK